MLRLPAEAEGPASGLRERHERRRSAEAGEYRDTLAPAAAGRSAVGEAGLHHEALDEGPGRRTDAVDPEGSGRPDRRGAFEVHRPQRKHDQGEALPGPPKAGKSSRQARQALYFVIWYTRSGRRSAKTGMQGSGESGRFTGPSEMREEVMHSLLSEHLE